jgi:hypothetical protein
LRVVGGVVAFLAGAGSALVEALLTPLRYGSWPLPVAPLLGALLGVPLVAYAARVTGSRAGAVAPAAGWFAMVCLLIPRTAEGDLILPESWMTIALFVVGGASLVLGLARVSGRTPRR